MKVIAALVLAIVAHVIFYVTCRLSFYLLTSDDNKFYYLCHVLFFGICFSKIHSFIEKKINN